MATIRPRRGPRGKKVFQVQIIRLGLKPQYRTFDTKTEAEAWARRVESEMDAGEWQDRSEGDRTTLGDALGRYLAEITPNKSPTTTEAERRRIAQLQKSKLGQVSLSRLTGKDIATYARRRLETVASATVKSELAIVSHMYKIAGTAWGMSYLVNPVHAGSTALPRLPQGRARRLTSGEETQLLAAASPTLGSVIRFALATCMRRGEIAALTWQQINLRARTALLPHTKNYEARTVPLAPAALEILRALPRRLDGSVFGLTPAGIETSWKRLIKKTGIRDLRFHDLRHEAISRLFENTDLDALEIARISGHKSLQMLSRYTHLRAGRLADRLAGIPRTGRRK